MGKNQSVYFVHGLDVWVNRKGVHKRYNMGQNIVLKSLIGSGRYTLRIDPSLILAICKNSLEQKGCHARLGSIPSVAFIDSMSEIVRDHAAFTEKLFQPRCMVQFQPRNPDPQRPTD
jgi:hypothetical protein